MKIEEIPQRINNWLASFEPSQVFLFGAGFSLLFFVLLWCLKPSKPKLSYTYEGGSVTITDNALYDFVRRSLSGKVDVLINKVQLIEKSNNYSLLVTLTVKPGVSLTEALPQIREILQNQCQDNLGVSNVKDFNISVRSFSADERSLAKSAKLNPDIESD